MATIRRGPLVVSKTDRREAYPVALRTTLVTSSLLLLIAAVPSPTVHASTETPRAAHYPIANRTWIQNLQQTTLFVAPATRPVGQTSTATPARPGYPSDLRTAVVSLATTTLTTVSVPHVATLTDLPPRAPAYPPGNRTLAGAPPLALTQTPVNPPSASRATPAPPAAIYPIDLRTLTARNVNVLGSSTQTYVQGRLNVAPQWAVPYPSACRTWTVSLVTSTLAPSAIPPFATTVTETPRGAHYPNALRTGISFFVEDDNNPPQPADTSTPRGRTYPHSLRTWTYNAVPILSLGLPVTRPTDYPTPRAAGYPSDCRTCLVTLQQTTLFSVAGTPVGAQVTETPRAAIYPPSNRSFALDLQQSTLFVAPTTPTTQHDWPTPRTSLYPNDLRTTISERSLVLKDVGVRGDGFPFQQYDWPTPRGPIYPHDLYTATAKQQINIPRGLVRRAMFRKGGSRTKDNL